MPGDLFSVPIFFIVLREALEASIVVSVLLSLIEQIVSRANNDSQPQLAGSASPEAINSSEPRSLRHRNVHAAADDDENESLLGEDVEGDPAAFLDTDKLVKKLRAQVFLGAAAGLAAAFIIGAVFLVVWYTQVVDLFSQNEEIWEGTFSLIACILILFMSVAMLRMDKAKAKWGLKLQRSFNDSVAKERLLRRSSQEGDPPTGIHRTDSSDSSGKYSLFLLPFVTVVREGVEAIVFIGGVSLGQEPSSIPLAAISGLLIGLFVGFLIYKSSSKTSLSVFLICSTNVMLLLGAGLLSRSVGAYERDAFNRLTGGDAAEAGNGPGSYDVDGCLWHLDCCNPENKLDAKGWAILNSLVGWSNNGSVGTVGAYVVYWWAAALTLAYLKWKEGRMGKQSQYMAIQSASSSAEDLTQPTGESSNVVSPESSTPRKAYWERLTSSGTRVATQVLTALRRGSP